MTIKHSLKVGISGVRGIVGDSFGPQLAMSFAQAFGTMVGRGSVVVGRDTRTTGPLIENAVVAGLLSVGCRPLIAGIVPTPTVLILTQELSARGGIMISASHNSGSWNALKFVDGDGFFLSGDRNEELIDIYHQRGFSFVPEGQLSPVEDISDPMEEHYRRIISYVDVKAIREKEFKVAVDCCNGVAALHATPFLTEKLGCEVVSVFDDPSGVFERVPEPTPENLKVLGQLVKENGCDIGFAQDPDGDRLAIVDETGMPIGEDLTLALAVQQILGKGSPKLVVTNLSTSKCVEAAAEQQGGQIIRTKIGEMNVVEGIFKYGAPIGGEGNGGVIVPEIHACRDAYAGMAIVLEAMAQSNESVMSLRNHLPKFVMSKETVQVRPEESAKILRNLRHVFEGENLNLLDGVLIDRGDSWAHVRCSNTEPVIRLLTEAPTQEQSTEFMNELRQKVTAATEKE